MSFWCNARLNSEITESNIRNIPHISDLCKPLSFGWCIILEWQSLNSTKLLAIGKSHLDFRLAKVNHRDILLSPEVFFYLNHAYIIDYFWGEVKLFLIYN